MHNNGNKSNEMAIIVCVYYFVLFLVHLVVVDGYYCYYFLEFSWDSGYYCDMLMCAVCGFR